jgi:ABC-2 type transport system permease protein
MVVTISPLAAQLMMLNPVAQIIQDARFFAITQDTLTITGVYGNPFMHLVPLAIVAIFAMVGVMYFKKKSPSFAEEI